jgi:glycosyltransferase involved in cell wall biosynthesis
MFFPPVGGGAEVYLGRLIKALGDNFDQYLWTTTPMDIVKAAGFGENCSIESFGSSTTIDSTILPDWIEKKYKEIAQSVTSWAQKIQCDLLILNTSFFYHAQFKSTIDSLKVAQPTGCIHHDIPSLPLSVLLDEYKKTENWEEALRIVTPQLIEISKCEQKGMYPSTFSLGTDFTIYNSEWTRGFFDPKKEKQSIIFHPLISRTHEHPKLGLKPVDFTIVNPLPTKGAVLFLALVLYHFRDQKFRILGGGYKSAMAKLEPFLCAENFGSNPRALPNNIEVLGHVQNMSEVYRNTKVLLQPSRLESYGMTSVEALFENCLVATTDIPGINEGVGEGALQMPYHSTPQEWADSISSALEHRDEWSEKISKRADFIQNRKTEQIAGLEQFLESMVIKN